MGSVLSSASLRGMARAGVDSIGPSAGVMASPHRLDDQDHVDGSVLGLHGHGRSRAGSILPGADEHGSLSLRPWDGDRDLEPHELDGGTAVHGEG